MATVFEQPQLAKEELNDSDFCSWALQQSKESLALREFAAEHRYNGNLDWDYLLEEVDYLAREELKTVGSLLKNIVSHLLYIEHFPTVNACPGWQAEVFNWRVEMRDEFELNPGMASKVTVEFQTIFWNAGVSKFINKFAESKKERSVYTEVLMDQFRWPIEEICGFGPRVREQDMPKVVQPSLPIALVETLKKAGADWDFADPIDAA